MWHLTRDPCPILLSHVYFNIQPTTISYIGIVVVDGCKINFLLHQKVKKLKFLQSDIQTFTQIQWLKTALRFNQSPSPNFIFMFCFLHHILSLYKCYFQPVGPGTWSFLKTTLPMLNFEYSKTPYRRPRFFWSPLYMVASTKSKRACHPGS